MNCIIVDDEPLAREGMQLLIEKVGVIDLVGSFGSASQAASFLQQHTVELVFLDIQMPGITGMEWAKTLPASTMVIFTTAYTEYALEGYEVDAIDYLVKPIKPERLQKAIKKALSYHNLLRINAAHTNVEAVAADYFFLRSDRRTHKIDFASILFIEGLKDYVVLYTGDQKIITAMNIKTIHEQLPAHTFIRISKSYVINIRQISSFDNNTVFIDKHEIPIGNTYRDHFFDEYVAKKMLKR